MNLLLVPLHLYGLPDEYKPTHAGLVARVYQRAEQSRARHHFFSVSHSDGLTRALISQYAAPKKLPEYLIEPLARLIIGQIDDLIEEKREAVESAYLFVRKDAGHKTLHDAVKLACERRSIHLTVYTSSDISDRVAKS